MSSVAPSSTVTVPVTLQWNKQTFASEIQLDETALQWKERIQAQNGVPVARQKLLWVQTKKKKNKNNNKKKSGWKGALKDTVVLDADTLGFDHQGDSLELTVTLIGSAEQVVERRTNATTKFWEDLTPEERQATERAQAQEAMANATGMISALQWPPHERHNQNQAAIDEWQSYNRLVTGLSQSQIEQELLKQNEDEKAEADSMHTSTMRLQGKVAMNMGLELRRAYVNDLCVLPSYEDEDAEGTCVSVLDDGHIQLWKHAEQQYDIVHPPGDGQEGGVDSVVALQLQNSSRGLRAPAFATAGRGVLQLWTCQADPLLTLQTPVPGTSFDSLVSWALSGDHTGFLAARLKVTRPKVDAALQFRLAPQNEAERQRRAQAEAQEQAIRESLERASMCVQVWWYNNNTNASNNQGPMLSSQLLEPPNASSPVTCLMSLFIRERDGPSISATETLILVAGDAGGSLWLWKATTTPITATTENNNANNQLAEKFVFWEQLQLGSESAPCSIVCMEPLPNGRLAVSTNVGPSHPPDSTATMIAIPHPRAVHILDVQNAVLSERQPPENMPTPTRIVSLTGHSERDGVICMCSLPNGDLLTGGGKLDATLQLWTHVQLTPPPQQGQTDDNDITMTKSEEGMEMADVVEGRVQSKAHKILCDVGYVFALGVLPDSKEGSGHYAVAAARYNTIKIVI